MNSEGHPMTKPLVPRKLVWRRDEETCSYSCETKFGRYEWCYDPEVSEGKIAPLWFCSLLEDQEEVELESRCTYKKAKAAAQQHYNELVAACCEVKRCVCMMQEYSLFGKLNREPTTTDRLEIMKVDANYCPNCGGLIEGEGC